MLKWIFGRSPGCSALKDGFATARVEDSARARWLDLVLVADPDGIGARPCELQLNSVVVKRGREALSKSKVRVCQVTTCSYRHPYPRQGCPLDNDMPVFNSSIHPPVPSNTVLYINLGTFKSSRPGYPCVGALMYSYR